MKIKHNYRPKQSNQNILSSYIKKMKELKRKKNRKDKREKIDQQTKNSRTGMKTPVHLKNERLGEDIPQKWFGSKIVLERPPDSLQLHHNSIFMLSSTPVLWQLAVAMAGPKKSHKRRKEGVCGSQENDCHYCPSDRESPLPYRPLFSTLFFALYL